MFARQGTIRRWAAMLAVAARADAQRSSGQPTGNHEATARGLAVDADVVARYVHSRVAVALALHIGWLVRVVVRHGLTLFLGADVFQLQPRQEDFLVVTHFGNQLAIRYCLGNLLYEGEGCIDRLQKRAI